LNAQIVSSVIGAIATAILAVIGRSIVGLRRDTRRFMGEHMWLLATTLWTRDNVTKVMDQLGMPVTSDPPENLPHRNKEGH